MCFEVDGFSTKKIGRRARRRYQRFAENFMEIKRTLKITIEIHGEERNVLNIQYNKKNCGIKYVV